MTLFHGVALPKHYHYLLIAGTCTYCNDNSIHVNAVKVEEEKAENFIIVLYLKLVSCEMISLEKGHVFCLWVP